MQVREELRLEDPTGLRLLLRGDAIVGVRTTEASWWLGLAGLAMLMVFLVSGLMEIAFALWNLQFLAVAATVVITALAVGFLSLFVLAVTHERLRITGRDAEWTLRLFALTLRRKTFPLDKIVRVETIYQDGDESGFWRLEVGMPKAAFRFGMEEQRANLDRLCALTKALLPRCGGKPSGDRE